MGNNKSNVLRLLIKGKLHVSIGGRTQCLPGGAGGARLGAGGVGGPPSTPKRLIDNIHNQAMY